MKKEIKPIYIITILIVPIYLNVSIQGLIVGKAYLKHVIVEGNLGIFINVIEVCICFYLFHKFCETYKEIYKISSITVSYIKVIISPFGFSLLVMLLYDSSLERYVNNNIVSISLSIVLIIITYFLLILKLKSLIKKYISK